ncbi:MAG: hypothetical protein J7501_08140 [Bdellovibrio sp.]|nr:hypothetical protein [Bdellovibrio sp.]
MSRLDVLIQRMTVQRECLNFLMNELQKKNNEGLVAVELGLGSGRTYDHIREGLPHMPFYVFDYKIDCHPSCEPAPEYAILGEIEKTLPPFAEKFQGKACLIHCDIGTKDLDRDNKVYSNLIPLIQKLSNPGTLIASDRPLSAPWLESIELPKDAGKWPYYLLRVT